jgi:hypothetical protein
MSFLSYKDFILRESRQSAETYLFEGGAYGHLSHPFEDFDLTIGDLQRMIDTTVNGAFGPENFVMEKTDGQNIMVSWKNGRLVAARNKSHLKNAGENALSIDALSQMFAGRGNIQIAFVEAMQDLTKAIGSLSEADKKKYFDEGKKFASVEVITPMTQNVIPYGQNMLVFHGVIEHNEAGEAVGEDKQAGRDLGKLIADVNAAVQKTFFVRGPQDIASKPFPNTKSRASYYNKKLADVMQESGTNPGSTVKDYVLGMGRKILAEEASKAKVVIPAEYMDPLVMRLVEDDKAYTVPQIKKDLGTSAEWFLDLAKNRNKEIRRKVYAPLENIFLEVGTEMMKNMSAFLSATPTAAAEEMRKEIDDVISKIKTTGDEGSIQKLDHELTRIAAAGGLESIVPTEGITFIFNGKLYKYTGIFAPLNQIRGMLVYGRR